MLRWAVAIGMLVPALLTGALASDTPVEHVATAPLPFVSELPAPVLPHGISEIHPSPNQQFYTSGQIRIRFADDLVPLSALESPRRLEVLSHFSIEPAVAGRFQILTPRLVVFSSDAPFANSTRYRITIRAGLEGLHGTAVPQTVAWTFTTGFDRIAIATPNDDRYEWHVPFPIHPTIVLSSSVPIDFGSLVERVFLHRTDSPSAIEVKVRRDPLSATQYLVTPVGDLDRNTAYKLEVRDGVVGFGQNIRMISSDGTFKTFEALRLIKVEQADDPIENRGEGRFTGGIPRFVFNNPLRASSAYAHVHVNRTPKSPYRAFTVSGDGKTIDFNPALFPADAISTITLDAQLTDAFGQSLGSPQSIAARTGDLAPQFWSVSRTVYLLPGARAPVPWQAVNLPEYYTRLSVLAPSTVALPVQPNPADDSGPLRGDWKRHAIASTRNSIASGSLFDSDPLGGGFGAFSFDALAETSLYHSYDRQRTLLPRRVTFNGVVSRSDIGLFAQAYAANTIVRTHSISTGEAIGGAVVKVFRALRDMPAEHQSVPCASGTTDGSGTLIFASLETCGAADALFVTVEHGRDWTFAQLSGPSYEPSFFGQLVADRQFVEPGERVHATLMSYRFSSTGTRVNQPFDIEMNTPDGKTVDLHRHWLSSFGITTFDVPFSKNAGSGTYQVVARGAEDSREAYQTDVTIASERKPLFQSAVAAQKASGATGDRVDVHVKSTYLAGSPVNGAFVTFRLTRTPSVLFFKDWQRFTFGVATNPGPLYAENYYVGGRFHYRNLQREPVETLATLRSNPSGEADLAVPVRAQGYSAMTYRVEAQTRDATNATVAAAATFTALQSDLSIGIAHDYTQPLASRQSISFIVVDPAGRAVRGVPVHFELQAFMADPDVDQSDPESYDRQWHDVSSRDVQSGQAEQPLTFDTNEGTRYRVRVTAVDARGRTSLTSAEFKACGSPVQPSPPPPALTLDKKTYRLGETIVASLALPVPSADVSAWISAMHGLQQYKHVSASNVQRFTFTVTRELRRGGTVQVFAVPGRSPAAGQTSPRTLSYSAAFAVQDQEELRVSVHPARAKIEPGATTDISVHVADLAGRPQRAQIVLAIVDRAVSQLAPVTWKDRVQSFQGERAAAGGSSFDNRDFLSDGIPLEKIDQVPYGFMRDDICPVSVEDQGLQVRSLASIAADTYALKDVGLVTARSAMNAPQVASRAIAGIQYRHVFHAVAFYAANLYTDASGSMHVRVHMPDNATTWDVNVIAATATAYTGSATASLETAKPLLVNPALPPFLRPGDSPLPGMLVTNSTGAAGSLSLRFGVTDRATFANAARAVEFSGIKAPHNGQSSVYRVYLHALAEGSSHARFGAVLNGRSDGFDLPFSIVQSVNSEDVAVTGRTKTSTAVPLVIPPAAASKHARVDLDLASTLLPELNRPLVALISDDYPTAYFVAAKIRALSDAVAFAQVYRQFATAALLRTQLRGALAQAALFARDDGGFSEFPGLGYGSDWVETARMTAALVRSNSIAEVPAPELTAGAVRYLNGKLREVSGCGPLLPWCAQRPLRSAPIIASIVALHDAGSDVSSFGDPCAGIASLRPWMSQLSEARAYARFRQCAAQAKGLRVAIVREMRETSRSLVRGSEKPGSYEGNVLSLLVETHAPEEQADRVLTGLLAAQHNGRWYNFVGDADALDGIADYAVRLDSPPEFTAYVRAGSARFTEHFVGYNKTHAQRTVPAAAFAHGSSSIELSKIGTGTLHYAAVLHYTIEGVSAGQYAGIRVDRFVRKASGEPAVATFSLEQPGVQTLDEGAVYDIEDRIVTDHPVDDLILVDPFPAGLEPINESFATSSTAERAPGHDWWDGYRFYGDYTNVTKDRTITVVKHLDAGAQSLHYLARATVPGTYLWPSVTARLQFVPEDFGRSAAGYITIKPAPGTVLLGEKEPISR